MGGVQEDAEAGGVRKGDGRRGLQRHNMGRRGGPLVPRDWVGEGSDGEVVGRPVIERDL